MHLKSKYFFLNFRYSIIPQFNGLEFTIEAKSAPNPKIKVAPYEL